MRGFLCCFAANAYAYTKMALATSRIGPYSVLNVALQQFVSPSLSGVVYETSAAQQLGGKRLLPRLPPFSFHGHVVTCAWRVACLKSKRARGFPRARSRNKQIGRFTSVRRRTSGFDYKPLPAPSRRWRRRCGSKATGQRLSPGRPLRGRLPARLRRSPGRC